MDNDLAMMEACIEVGIVCMAIAAIVAGIYLWRCKMLSRTKIKALERKVRELEKELGGYVKAAPDMSKRINALYDHLSLSYAVTPDDKVEVKAKQGVKR